jgi:hypothetical protein
LTSNLRSDVNEIERVAINIISAQNEQAKILGYYEDYVDTTVDGIKKRTLEKVTVIPGTNPCIGLSENNDILLKEFYQVPILSSGFDVIGNDNNKYTINDAINVFVKENGNWEMI